MNTFSDKIAQIQADWKSEKTTFDFYTSGTTGSPKKYTFLRKDLKMSASITCRFFGLGKGDTFLLCLNPDFIAGYMQVVRSEVVGGKNIVIAPDKVAELNSAVDFAALVPLQLEKLINNGKIHFFEKAKAVIIGGTTISEQLLNKIQQLPFPCFHTFGMTETLTHIALKRLNPITEDFYTILPEFKTHTDQRGCLVIDTPYSHKTIVTNDLVKLEGNRLEWLGRIDNTINSGGIKLQAEALESEIRSLFEELNIKNEFVIAKASDDILGEKVVLKIEGEIAISTHELFTILKKKLPLHHTPKIIELVSQFKRTNSGKIVRN